MLAPFSISAQSLQPPLQSVSDLYLSAFFNRHSLGVVESSEQLKPTVASAAIGYWVREGIGLELEAGFGLTDDSVGNLDVDFQSKLGLNLRLESPHREGFAMYALFGYVRTAYDATVGGQQSSISLPGGRVALGLTYLINRQTVLDAAFSHHDYDGETRINSFRLGVRFDLGS